MTRTKAEWAQLAITKKHKAFILQSMDTVRTASLIDLLLKLCGDVQCADSGQCRVSYLVHLDISTFYFHSREVFSGKANVK